MIHAKRPEASTPEPPLSGQDTPSAATSRMLPARLTLIGFGVLITLIGQVWLYVTPIEPTVAFPSAAWLSLLGGALFAVANFLPTRLLSAGWPRGLRPSRHFAWILASLALTTIAAGAAFAFEHAPNHQYMAILTVWLLGAGSYAIAFLPEVLSLPDLSVLWHRHRAEMLALIAIVAFGVGLRFYRLGTLPIVINGDEGLIGLFAQSTSDGALANPFGLWENIGTLYLQLINVSLRVFGTSPFALRLLPAIGGSLAVLTTYLLARRIAGPRVALLAALLLATSHIHLHFSRTVAVTYIQGTWLVPLELYLLLSGIQDRANWRVALSGVLLAIHMDVYITAQIVTGILAAYTLFALVLRRRQFSDTARSFAVFWGGFTITVVPQASYMLRQPAELMSRLNAEGTFNSGWLAAEIATTGKSMAQILVERVAHAFLSLIYYPAIDFYGSPMPVLSFVAAVLFLLGLGYVLLRARSLDGLLLNGYFWGMTVAVGTFAIPPSADSYRMIVALPAAMILASIGLDQVLTQVGLGWSTNRIRYGALVSILFAGLISLNTWTYFFDFVGRCRYGGDPQTRFASHLGTVVNEVKSEGAVFLLSDAVYFYGSHASVDFLTRRRPIQNVAEPVAGLQAVSGETVIASTPRINELLEWARAHPGGELHYERDCGNVILLAYNIP